MSLFIRTNLWRSRHEIHQWDLGLPSPWSARNHLLLVVVMDLSNTSIGDCHPKRPTSHFTTRHDTTRKDTRIGHATCCAHGPLVIAIGTCGFIGQAPTLIDFRLGNSYCCCCCYYCPHSYVALCYLSRPLAPMIWFSFVPSNLRRGKIPFPWFLWLVTHREPSPPPP